MALARVVNTPQVNDALLWLLTFRDPIDNVVLRAVNNIENIISNGEEYTAFPFELVLPPDDGQRVSNLKLVFMNVDQRLTDLIRAYPPGRTPQVRFDLVISDQPDLIEKTIDFMEVASVTYNVMNITFDLVNSSIFARKTNQATYNQSEFPGMFWGLK